MSDSDPGIDPSVPPSGPGCVECTTTNGWWFHLRRCTRHQFIRSYEPGESWFYIYADEQMYDGPELAAPQHHPLDQATPGPAGSVPADWQRYLN